MWQKIRSTYRPPLLAALLVICFVFSSCAAVGKLVHPNIWLGLLDLAAAGAIILYIGKGGDKG